MLFRFVQNKLLKNSDLQVTVHVSTGNAGILSKRPSFASRMGR